MVLIGWATRVLQRFLQNAAIMKIGANRIKITLVRIVKLQLVNMKMESIVIVNQHVTVNKYLSFVHTARHMLEVYFILRKLSNL